MRGSGEGKGNQSFDLRKMVEERWKCLGRILT